MTELRVTKLTHSAKHKFPMLPRLVKAACASALLHCTSQVKAVAIDANLAQVAALSLSGSTSNDMVGNLFQNMAQDGVIRIPIQKEPSTFLSQTFAAANPESKPVLIDGSVE